ncbi:SDR family oxidoreductase [Bacteroidota bacterium]
MKCVLITGATGVIGSELVPLFLESGDWEIRLVVRARSESHLQERFERLIAYWDLEPGISSTTGRIKMFAGDVCRPHLGLDDAAYRQLGGEVTHVIHSAGNVKLNQSVEEATDHTVGSVSNVLEFVAICQDHQHFQKLDVVSTIGVAGRMDGLIPERPITQQREYHNSYEMAKSKAEDLLFEKLADGLPVTVHRPSMVVGDAKTGRVAHFQVFYYLCDFLAGKRTHGIIFDPSDATLDIIPVDYVARAIRISAGDQDSVGRVFHLCSGRGRSVCLSDLVLRTRVLAAAGGTQLPKLRRLPQAWFRRFLPYAERLSWGTARRVLAGLPYFLTYLDETQSFAVDQTEAYFSERDLVVQNANEYLDRILKYYLQDG